jgi:hypothetical protein
VVGERSLTSIVGEAKHGEVLVCFSKEATVVKPHEETAVVVPAFRGTSCFALGIVMDEMGVFTDVSKILRASPDKTEGFVATLIVGSPVPLTLLFNCTTLSIGTDVVVKVRACVVSAIAPVETVVMAI